MPRHEPFTALCQELSRLRGPQRADLHVHTTASDGEYTPGQVVALARQANLAAVAVTDHDTLAGAIAACGFTLAAPAETLPSSVKLAEVIPGVEITAEFDGREIHLLGYFVCPDHPGLTAAMERLCARRRERFRDYLTKLAAVGTVIPEDRAKLVETVSPSLGRRHVAGLLLACGVARFRNEAFGRFLGPLGGKVVPKERLGVADAIGLVRAAGGVTSLAHPPADFGDDEFGRLRAAGLDAIEVEYPWGRSSQAGRLREVAGRFGFLTTGGSDCHGPEPSHRRIGSHGVTAEQFARLRDCAARAGSGAPISGSAH